MFRSKVEHTRSHLFSKRSDTYTGFFLRFDPCSIPKGSLYHSCICCTLLFHAMHMRFCRRLQDNRNVSIHSHCHRNCLTCDIPVASYSFLRNTVRSDIRNYHHKSVVFPYAAEGWHQPIFGPTCIYQSGVFVPKWYRSTGRQCRLPA